MGKQKNKERDFYPPFSPLVGKFKIFHFVSSCTVFMWLMNFFCPSSHNHHNGILYFKMHDIASRWSCFHTTKLRLISKSFLFKHQLLLSLFFAFAAFLIYNLTVGPTFFFMHFCIFHLFPTSLEGRVHNLALNFKIRLCLS